MCWLIVRTQRMCIFTEGTITVCNLRSMNSMATLDCFNSHTAPVETDRLTTVIILIVLAVIVLFDIVHMLLHDALISTS